MPGSGPGQARRSVPSGAGGAHAGTKGARPLEGNPALEVVVLTHRPRGVDVVGRFAQDHGLTVVAREPRRRFVVLSGSLEAVATAFGVGFVEYQGAKGTFRDVEAGPTLPAEVAEAVAFVHGLETRAPASRRRAAKEGEAQPVAWAARIGEPKGQKLGSSPGDRAAEVVVLLSDASALAELSKFAARHDLVVLEANDKWRLAVLSGRLSDLAAAFNVGFERYGLNGRAYRVVTRPPSVAASIAGDIIFVHGLETPLRTGAQRVALPGTTCAGRLGARRIGDADPDEVVRATIVLQARRRGLLRPRGPRPWGRRHLSRAAFLRVRGALPNQLDRVEAFAVRQGLRVLLRDPARRTVVVSGRVRDVSRAFRVRLCDYAHGNRTYRGLDAGEQVTLPRRLAPLVLAVLGLENLPVARPHLKIAAVRPRAVFYPTQIAARYQFPTGGAAGQTIGIVELGGGFDPTEITTYFSGLGRPVPSVVAVSADGTQNSPTGDPNGADGEVVLDIEVAGAVAPGAAIAVYFGANSDQGFLDCVNTAIHDTQNDPGVLSISWGAAESDWPAGGRDALNQAFEDASTLGVTVFAASGDNGSSDGVSDGQNHVDFPASSPFVTGCGGTTLLDPSGEAAWSGSGGGVSAVFDKPTWQSSAPVPPPQGTQGGRGVPDVAGDADPSTGYQILVDGTSAVFGGTSAVAPLWAGLVAVLNNALGSRVGFLNPLLYSALQSAGGLSDVTTGDNGAFQAGTGWDPVTGWGTPKGNTLLKVLVAAPPPPPPPGEPPPPPPPPPG